GHLGRAARGDRLLVEIGVAGDDLHAEEAAAELGDAAADIADADDADGAPLDVIAHEDAAVMHRAAPQGVIGLDDLLGEHQHHGEHVRRHRLGVAAGLVDDEHAGVGAVLTLTVSKPAPLVETMSRFGMRSSSSRWTWKRGLSSSRADPIW